MELGAPVSEAQVEVEGEPEKVFGVPHRDVRRSNQWSSASAALREAERRLRNLTHALAPCRDGVALARSAPRISGVA